MKKSKVSSFPTLSLAASVELITKIVKSRGEVVSTTKDISLVTGIGEGTLPLQLSSCCQYKIYESGYGSGYRPTELFQRISIPTFAGDKKIAEFEALGNPSLYKELLDEFNGKVLPDEKGLTNYLMKRYGFKTYAMPKIVKSFYENFSPYIDANNKLRFILSNNDDPYTPAPLYKETNGNPAVEVDKRAGVQPVSLASALTLREGTYNVHIIGEGINSTLTLADEDDFLILEAMINKLKKKIKGEQKQEMKIPMNE
ncbi:MAG TPA: hypothetical protein VJY62_10500 [Bacteroidia bacterium]|nr:hypothetical protein [Bacteroidia bacterium]